MTTYQDTIATLNAIDAATLADREREINQDQRRDLIASATRPHPNANPRQAPIRIAMIRKRLAHA